MQKNVKIIAGAVVVLLLVVFVAWFLSPERIRTGGQAQVISSTTSTMNKNFNIKTVSEGTGEGARLGQTVAIHYVGTLTTGAEFDSSRKRGMPFEFTLGQGVIEGFTQGVLGMKVGEKRIVTIPPEMAYGDMDIPGIPAGSTLIFELELMALK